MQDKEFDELFRSGLKDLEVEPSKELWDNIAAEVVIDRPNRSVLPYISIAATILVLLGAGLLFIPKQHKQSAGQHTIVKVKKQVKPLAQPKAITPLATESLAEDVASVKKTVKPVHSLRSRAVVTEQQTVSSQPSKGEQTGADLQPLVAIKEPATVLATVTPEADINTTTKQVIADQVIVAKEPVEQIAIANVKPVNTGKPRKRGIRSFGDLINVVVNKVDKRKDKLIEFGGKDEDDSMITGVNLGILKIKKEETIATNK
ncbi:hypothetical protein [Mucilaginibacter terrenus]|nr:hypothetical protein [Mucilaginibacter terrenus]